MKKILLSAVAAATLSLALSLLGCSSSGGPFDFESPSTPVTVRAVVDSTSQITLSWKPSTDNVAVVNYRIYKEDNRYATSLTPSITIPGLTQRTMHCFKITAVDLAGNESEKSLNTCANTGALTLQGLDPTAEYGEFARYGDYLSAQLKSLKKFGYGMFIVKMQAADGPVCSTFWLYSDAPAPGAMPEIRQLWRWNEFDFEFVPYTQATQNSFKSMSGSFPNPAVKHYGAKIANWDSFETQKLSPQSIAWTENWYLTDDTIAADMQHFYNRWMVTGHPDYYLSDKDYNFEGLKKTTGDPHQTGWLGTPAGKQPGWTFAMDWKYPLTAVSPVPAGYNMKQMLTINWWRAPEGNQSIDVNLPGYDTQTFQYIIRNDIIKGIEGVTSREAAVLNNESYIFPNPWLPGMVYSPYTALSTYTVVWTKTRVAFYVNAGNDGKDIAGSTPVAVFTTEQYPSIKASGTQAAQGNITWADTSLTDALGKVSINLANYVAFKAAKNVPYKTDFKDQPNCPVGQTCSTNTNLPEDQKAGAGWSGNPPGSDWAGADAYFRSVHYYPLTDENNSGTQNTHFDFASADKWIFDLADGSWTADSFRRKITQYFGILYAQDYTKDDITFKVHDNKIDFDILSGTLRDSKSPLAVIFEPNTDGAIALDGKPLMKLSVRPSIANPIRNFFFVTTKMDTGKPISAANPFMFATIDTDGTGAAVLGISGASTPLSFYGPAPGKTVTATIKVYSSTTYKGSFPPGHVPAVPTAQGIVKLTTAANGSVSWSFVSGSKVVEDFQSANPHLMTIKVP
ncbi:MAG: hypothetical protein K4571_04215 [Deltaproteobacteria bacterium]